MEENMRKAIFPPFLTIKNKSAFALRDFKNWHDISTIFYKYLL